MRKLTKALAATAIAGAFILTGTVTATAAGMPDVPYPYYAGV